MSNSPPWASSATPEPVPRIWRINMMRHRVLAGVLATLLALSACGDDDDGGQAANSTTTAEATTTSTGDELCAAIDDAEQDIGAVGDIDVLAEGTNAVEASLTTIREDLAEIKELAPDTAETEEETAALHFTY